MVKNAEEETYTTHTASTAIAVTGVRAARARTHLIRKGIGNVLWMLAPVWNLIVRLFDGDGVEVVILGFFE